MIHILVPFLPLVSENLFDGINWGTSEVFKQQSKVAKSLGIKLDVLPQILQDVVRSGYGNGPGRGWFQWEWMGRGWFQGMDGERLV